MVPLKQLFVENVSIDQLTGGKVDSRFGSVYVHGLVYGMLSRLFRFFPRISVIQTIGKFRIKSKQYPSVGC